MIRFEFPRSGLIVVVHLGKACMRHLITFGIFLILSCFFTKINFMLSQIEIDQRIALTCIFDTMFISLRDNWFFK